MYRDAKEELKRLEEALLEVDDGSEEMPLEEDLPEENDVSQWDIDIEDAISDIPDLPEPEQKEKSAFGLTVAVITLAASVVGMLIFLWIRYGGLLL